MGNVGAFYFGTLLTIYDASTSCGEDVSEFRYEDYGVSEYGYGM